MIAKLKLLCGLFLLTALMLEINIAMAVVRSQVKPDSTGVALLTDVSQPVLVNPNKTSVVIRLPANQTTGYAWFLQSYDRNRIRYLHDRYVPPNTHLIGAPGYTEFTFKVLPTLFKNKERLLLIFVYKRPWEKEAGYIQKITIMTRPVKNE